jgi:hypothetical protein
MEDDDLFWRCILEGYADIKYLDYKGINKSFLRFDGQNSFVRIPTSPTLEELTSKSHTVSILARSFQQEEKMPVYLIGAEDRDFVEYPIFRRPGFDYGISYNNSRAYAITIWDKWNRPYYQWMKRYENQWSWITFSVSIEAKQIRVFMNGIESKASTGTGTNSPVSFEGFLRNYRDVDYFLGTTTALSKESPGRFFKGDIAELKIWDRSLTPEEINQSFSSEVEGLVLDYDFNHSKLLKDRTGNNNNGLVYECEKLEEDIKVNHTIIPYRTPGKMECLKHPDEGFHEGKWIKGETTARNEKRFILEMQQGKIDYKKDGINNVKYTVVGIEELTPKAKMINVIL